jgi:hypothetical protein
MTDEMMNQKRYEREAAKPAGFAWWQCALMVVGVFALFNSLIYWVG